MSFLPDDYKVPEAGGNYMRFEEGETKFTVLSPAITGYLYWLDADGNVVPRGELGGEGSKPIRVKDLADIEHRGAQYEAKHFWAFKVWNHEQEKIQILEITQRRVMRQMEALGRSKDWGDPFEKGYAITVLREGKGFDTNYTVVPSPKTKFEYDAELLEKINLDALYTGDDPFSEDIDPAEVKASIDAQPF